MNNIIILVILVLAMGIVYFAYRYLEKRGLYFALIFLNIITFITSFKTTYIFRLNTNLGIISYIITLSIIYISLIKYGKKETTKMMTISLYTNIALAFFLGIMNYYIPAITETISINMEGVFKYNYKLLILFPFMMLLSQFLTVKLYTFLTGLQGNRNISILLTYIITGLIYTVIFYLIAYIKILSIKNSIFLGTTTYIVGLVNTIINIIFINFLIGSKKVKK